MKDAYHLYSFLLDTKQKDCRITFNDSISKHEYHMVLVFLEGKGGTFCALLFV